MEAREQGRVSEQLLAPLARPECQLGLPTEGSRVFIVLSINLPHLIVMMPTGYGCSPSQRGTNPTS